MLRSARRPDVTIVSIPAVLIGMSIAGCRATASAQTAVVLVLGIIAAAIGWLIFKWLRADSASRARDDQPFAHELHENVQFTVYRPKVVQPMKWHPLLAFAHLDERPADAAECDADPVAEVQRLAAQALGPQLGDYKDITQDSFQAVHHAGSLLFVPELEGAEFNPCTQSVRFTESVHKVEFRMRAAADRDGQTLRGRLSVFSGSVLLADVPLQIKVDSRLAGPARTESEPMRRYRKIFASYSHRDLAIVEQWERFAEALGDRYLRDWTDLRAGEIWNDRLQEMIEEADVFQLFWSRNSMNSKFCRREWEFALSLNRDSFVRPTYWEDPFPESPSDGLPPEQLRRLHFTKVAADHDSERTAGAPSDGGTVPSGRHRYAPAAAALVALVLFTSYAIHTRWLGGNSGGNGGRFEQIAVLNERFDNFLSGGEVALARGDLEEAGRQFREANNTVKELANIDAGNVRWQRDLSVSVRRMADVAIAESRKLAEEKQWAAAIQRAEVALKFEEALADRDPFRANGEKELQECRSWLEVLRQKAAMEQSGALPQPPGGARLLDKR